MLGLRPIYIPGNYRIISVPAPIAVSSSIIILSSF